MKVSVLIITYNQEEFIAKAVNSVLRQEVNFDYEIVIGDDCSTDRTRDILIEFASTHPQRTRLLLQEKKLKGLPGKLNFIKTLKACEGQYLALLDGDDYWISPHKLQKQVDFLDRHPECSVSFHDVVRFGEDELEPPQSMYPPEQKEFSTLEDILSAGVFPMPCGALFRNKYLRELPECFAEVPNGDWMLSVLAGEHGDFGYLNEAMAAYRVHAKGFWSRKNRAQAIREQIRTYKTIDAYLNFKYERVLSKRIEALRDWLVKVNKEHVESCLAEYHQLVRNGEIGSALRRLWAAARFDPLQGFHPRSLMGLVKSALSGNPAEQSRRS